MKKLFVFAVFLVVIGILCAVFFIGPKKEKTTTDEKPWTVGESVAETETVSETTKAEPVDAVEAFAAFIDEKLRDSFTLLNEEERYAENQLSDVVYGLYIYDVDTDGTEELAVVRSGEDAKVFLDVYEFGNGNVRLADTIQLVLDSANEIALAPDLTSFSQIAARLTIYPKGSDRYFCLTVEQQGRYGDYNAYTAVFAYAKEKLTAKQSFRLRRIGETITLMRLNDATLLYRLSPESEDDVALAKYTDLSTAFKTEFAKLGLQAPDVRGRCCLRDGKRLFAKLSDPTLNRR